MFLNQQKGYNVINSAKQMLEDIREAQPNYVVYDTETTGLDLMKDVPFLIVVGFDKNLYWFEPTQKNLKYFEEMVSAVNILIAHNSKYDYHMMLNLGVDMTDYKLGDSMTVARLTQYADGKIGLGLEALGAAYVDDNAKFAGKVIKKQINEINKQRRKELREFVKANYKSKYKEIMDGYDKRVQFVSSPFDSVFEEMDKIYSKPTYYDAYKEDPNLMVSYALDDVAITLEYLKSALPVLSEVDPGLKTFKREGRLTQQIGQLERVGLKADVNYLLESRERVKDYKEKLYEMLHKVAGRELTSGQHKVIKSLLEVKWGIVVDSVDVKHLKQIMKNPNEEVKEFASIIVELRTVEKWLSTYIEGMLNRIKNGRVHTSINNSGAVSGRVSSDLQQQPKEPLKDRDGNELFHPRRVFINDEDYRTFYFDYSQMELRLQAQYTIWVSGGDVNLCRAYIPFQYTSCLTGEIYDTKNDYNDWNSGEWVDEQGDFWVKTDLHSATTAQAFPEVAIDSEEFTKLRKYGKIANFLKNYGGGIDAIISQLGVSEEIARKLDEGYYKAFPTIKDYQDWVNEKLHQNGHVYNLYGRRYYIQDSRNFYKGINYVIQGGCADMIKAKQLEIWDYLRENNCKSKMLLPVHDEIQVMIHKDEEHLVPHIQEIMQDTKNVMPDVPMICDIEVTDTNWAEKRDYE